MSTESMTPGKLAGLKAVSEKRGVIAAAAMDQRGSLKKSLAKEKGVAEVPDSALIEFKELVTEVLTKHASAILLDPEFGLPAAKRRNGKGLLLAYEKTGYDAALPGRLPDLLDLWSVRRLKEAGADCIKVLLYYTPYEKSQINDHKHAWTERIGDECHRPRHPLLPRAGRLRGPRRRREEHRLCQAQARHRHRLHGGVRQGALRCRRAEGRSARADGVRGRHAAPSRASRPTRARKPWSISASPPPPPTSRSSISLPEFRTRSSSRPSSWRMNRASVITAFSADAPPGKTASPSTPNRARKPSRHG